MNRNDIIRMAREAGLRLATDVNWMPIIGLEYAEKFAGLVAAEIMPKEALAEMFEWGKDAGRREEREACAKICDEKAEEWVETRGWIDDFAKEIGEAIRTRREQ